MIPVVHGGTAGFFMNIMEFLIICTLAVVNTILLLFIMAFTNPITLRVILAKLMKKDLIITFTENGHANWNLAKRKEGITYDENSKPVTDDISKVFWMHGVRVVFRKENSPGLLNPLTGAMNSVTYDWLKQYMINELGKEKAKQKGLKSLFPKRSFSMSFGWIFLIVLGAILIFVIVKFVSPALMSAFMPGG